MRRPNETAAPDAAAETEEKTMSFQDAARHDAARDRRETQPADQRLQDRYGVLGPHLRAALLHARTDARRDRPEPSGGDSDMD
jgi:hypothetical protein